MARPAENNTPTIILTRPQQASQQTMNDLATLVPQDAIRISPLLSIEPTGVDVELAEGENVIFTSRNAVEHVPAQSRIAWCVGDATAKAATQKGWHAISAGGDAETLFQRITTTPNPGSLMHLRGEVATGNLAQRLIDANIQTRDVVVYRQIPKDMTAEAGKLLSGGNPVILPLYSPNTARHLCAQGPFRAPLVLVAISKAVEKELLSLPRVTCIVSDAATGASMLNAIKLAWDLSCRIEHRPNLA